MLTAKDKLLVQIFLFTQCLDSGVSFQAYCVISWDIKSSKLSFPIFVPYKQGVLLNFSKTVLEKFLVLVSRKKKI